MPSVRPMKFFLPAVFLLVLGLGNITVGYYKEWQYRQVYEELNELEPNSKMSSALGRIQAVPQTKDRREQRQLEATERRNLYQMVGFGGKALVFVSLLLFSAAAIARYTYRKTTRAVPREQLPDPRTV